MLPYSLDKINANVLVEICSQRFSESGTIDFKKELTKSDDRGKNELAKDVCALANADGGDLVFGIGEDKAGGTAENVVPITDESFDQASRRFLQTLEAWVEPKIQGLQIKNVDVDGGFVMVLRVPSSFDGPHCIRNGNSQRRFVVRNGTTTADMSYDQIRRSFDRTSSLIEQARRLIDQRLLLIQERKTARPVDAVPLSAVEVVPLASLAGRVGVDVGALYDRGFSDYIPKKWNSGAITRSLNLDGLLVYQSGRETSNAWTNIFRDGRYETVMIGGRDTGEKRVIWSSVVSQFFQQGVESALLLAKKQNISGPAIVRLALMHVDGFTFEVNGDFWDMENSLADRNHLVLPEILIDDVSVDIDVAALLTNSIDVLWHCFSLARPKDQQD